jgi:signal transduction histidine kinase
MDKPIGRVRIECTEEDDYWQFKISDNGPGIEERYFGKIFEIFQILSIRDETESIGIGLPIVKKIIEMYDGRIWVESTPGQGSSFFFTLPKKESVETEHAAAGLQTDIIG